MTPTRPTILTVGTSDALHTALHTAGGSVRGVTSLLHAYTLVVPRPPTPPTLLLLDLATSDRACTAPQLVAVLARRMRLGAIPLAWLVGIVPDSDPDLAGEAALAGCHLILHAPLRDDVAAGLVRLAATPALVPPDTRATLVYQGLADARWSTIPPGQRVEGRP